MSDTDASDRTWRTTVNRIRQSSGGYGLDSGIAYTYEHRGPADFKLDSQGNLRVEVYPENSDFEVVIALHLAGTFHSVSQEVLPEADEDEDENCPCEDCGDGRLVQVHDPNAQEW